MNDKRNSVHHPSAPRGLSRDVLSQLYLFRDLSRDFIDRLAGLAVIRRLGRDEMLFLKGDEADGLYGVLSGAVKISTSSAGGKEMILSVMRPGDAFGEIALLDGQPRTADASGIEPSELFLIRRADFLDLLRSEPALAIHLLELLCERMRRTNEIIEDTAFLDLPARLAKRLLALGRAAVPGAGPEDPLTVHISQANLANIMGTTRESINKHLQVWRQEGSISLKRGQVCVVDQAALEELIENAYDF